MLITGTIQKQFIRIFLDEDLFCLQANISFHGGSYAGRIRPHQLYRRHRQQSSNDNFGTCFFILNYPLKNSCPTARSDIENIGLKDTIFWDLNCFLSFYDNWLFETCEFKVVVFCPFRNVLPASAGVEEAEQPTPTTTLFLMQLSTLGSDEEQTVTVLWPATREW